jgi:phytanoyl-CoA hydroxylase
MTASVSTGSPVRVEDIEVFADRLNVLRAAAIYKEHGCLVVRGLMNAYLPELQRDIEAAAAQSLALLDQARRVPEGWVTPNGTLFLPAPPHYTRDKQIMVLAVSYYTSAAFFRSALDTRAVEVVEAILGSNIELYLNGQCLYKEPVGGHPKHLHQDAAYFEHKYEGPVGVLSYMVDTDLVNGALHVAPGSHRMGVLTHIDTFSHLGLDAQEWPWERALPIVGSAGDSIFFHVKTVHGSKENYSDKPRPVVINRYRAADDYVTVSGTTTENRAENEKRVAEAKKENQRGLMLRGFRAYDANRE